MGAFNRGDGEWLLADSTKGNKTLDQVANWIDPERLSAVVDSRPFIKESTGDKTLYKVLIAWLPYEPDDDDEKPAASDDITPTPSPKKR